MRIEPTVSLAEAAKLLGLARGTIYNGVAHGKFDVLRPIKLPIPGARGRAAHRWRFPVAALEAFYAEAQRTTHGKVLPLRARRAVPSHGGGGR